MFTATGDPVASLNLWSRTAVGLHPLNAALEDQFSSYAALIDWRIPAYFAPGERQLLEGTRAALELRMVVHRAIGYLAAQNLLSIEEAFQWLRSAAHIAGIDVGQPPANFCLTKPAQQPGNRLQDERARGAARGVTGTATARRRYARAGTASVEDCTRGPRSLDGVSVPVA